ncbi:MAG: efflux RND transporter permease subunit [Proteobacteria bacterium]|nr:efflux RND transporter permease subunit [Pseudomonadota bacterium]
MKKLLTALVGNTVLANILLIMALFAGLAAALSMVREEMPNVLFDEIEIVVAYPGADPAEIEEGISRKIEEAVDGMEGVKSYRTIAEENRGLAVIEINEKYDSREVFDRVRSKIDGISSFPLEAEKPIVTLPVHSEAVMAVYLSGDMSEKALKEWAYTVKDEILQLPDISQVEMAGTREYEINVEVSEQRLQAYGISLSQVADAIRRSNLNRSGGLIRTDAEEIRVRTEGRKYTGEELAKIIVLATLQGESVALGQLASIRDGFSELAVKSKVNGQPAVLLNVFKTTIEDTIRMSESVHDYLERKKHSLPPGAEIGILFDNSDSIRQQINILTKNGAIGLILVFVLLWLFLSGRLSFWTGTGILVSLVGGLAAVWMAGGTLNVISIFGFIMILGIVADDAIVVGEAIAWHRKKGASPLKAAVDGISEVGMPVIAAVLTTITAFLPLLFIEGMMGKIIRVLPMVVIACLLVSLVESFVLLPAHLSHLPDPNRVEKRSQRWRRWPAALPALMSEGLERFSRGVYRPILEKALIWRYVFFSLTIAFFLISLGLIQGNLVKFEMLPKRDGVYMTATIEFPAGTSLETTENAVRELENALLRVSEKASTQSGDPLVRNVLCLNGQQPGDDPGDMGAVGSHLGGLQVWLLESEKRGIHIQKLIRKWQKEVGTLHGVKSLAFSGIAMGPPGKPIEIGVDGQHLEDMQAAANDVMDRLRQFEGVFDVQSDLAPGKNEIRFRLKPEARGLGLTVEDLANQVNAAYYGQEALRIQRGRNEIKIRVRYTADERSRISSLDGFKVRTQQGYEVPLGAVAEIRYGPGVSSITRMDGRRRIKVSADVDTAVVHSNEIIDELTQGFFRTLENRYPGVHIVLDGEAAESETAFDSLYVAFPLAVIGIFMLIATLFRSYLQPLIIMFTLPFGLIGAIWGHFILGWDMTMIGLFGMVGLAGIVVNDAIVLMERINANLAEGLPFMEAVLNGGVRRFRAVFLTTVTTVGGLVPLIMEKDLYAQFIIPMAITIVSGVIFATVLTLILIPSLLVILNDFRLLFHWIKTGLWTSREEVEPARYRKSDWGERGVEGEKVST